jgi:hypothetical protein
LIQHDAPVSADKLATSAEEAARILLKEDAE